jgi:hypothetical protein
MTEVEMISSFETHFMTSANPRSTNFESLYTVGIQTSGKSNSLTDMTNSVHHTSLPIRMNSSTPTEDLLTQTNSTGQTRKSISSQKTSPFRSSTASQALSAFLYPRSSMTPNSPEQTTHHRTVSSTEMFHSTSSE